MRLQNKSYSNSMEDDASEKEVEILLNYNLIYYNKTCILGYTWNATASIYLCYFFLPNVTRKILLFNHKHKINRQILSPLYYLHFFKIYNHHYWVWCNTIFFLWNNDLRKIFHFIYGKYCWYGFSFAFH